MFRWVGFWVEPPGAVEEEEEEAEEEAEVPSVYRWAGSLPGRVMLPRWRTGSGWASVLKTQLSNGIRSSLENKRYRYLGGGEWEGSGKEEEEEVNDITATKNSNTFCRLLKEQSVSFKGPWVKTLKTKDALWWHHEVARDHGSCCLHC